MSIHLNTPIEKLTRVGKVTSDRLVKLGVTNVKELLEHYPTRFEDYSKKILLNQLLEGEIGSIFGTITHIEQKKTPRKQMKLTEAEIDDGNGSIKIIWFNQPYITQTIQEGDTIAIAGKIEKDYTGWLMKNPNFEKAQSLEQTVHTSRLVPVYGATYGITQKQIRFLTNQALTASEEFIEIIPDEILKKANLINKIEAIKNIHLPSDLQDYLNAQKRLKFEELFLIQLLVEQSKNKVKNSIAPKIEFKEKKTKEFVSSLPFKLTDDQKKASWKILKDLENNYPMNRLLQGEVGSGKTVVSAIAALNTSESGYQTALMAPTEILALQHYKTISEILPNKSIALLTSKHAKINTNRHPELVSGSAPDSKKQILNQVQHDENTPDDIKKLISENKIDIIIGTHAIIQNSVIFANLGLIIIDEQHRFGVEQRKSLRSKDAISCVSDNGSGSSPTTPIPHLLSMTATPIPRSLALTLYGDLDITTIKQIPKNRKPIQTKVVDENNRNKAYEFIKQKISQNQQVFVVCPLIEESDTLGVKSVTAEYKKLNEKIFPNIKIGLLHGKLKSKEKEDIMNEFNDNKTSILVSTSVVEVGVDIPNAVVMMIEGSERFGLSQLHQFRGRVGRGDKQSYCFLFTDSKNPETKNRLELFVKAKDGFEIAELDLSLRGPGQVYGIEQSGHLASLNIATLFDVELINETKEFAKQILETDPILKKYPTLKSEIEKQGKELHFE
jgi:ATP-dependent DNA helicase RecG